MINVISPRIHNLGDFSHCLPVLSGLYKKYNVKINFILCDRLSRFKGLKELLKHQKMFHDVSFISENYNIKYAKGIILDDTENDEGLDIEPIFSRKMYNYISKNYNLEFEIDNDFILEVGELENIQKDESIQLIGDRWSPKYAPDVDDRRTWELIRKSNKFTDKKYQYIDYTKDLLYNCKLIKANPNPFITTFTGICHLVEYMNLPNVVLYDDDYVEFIKTNCEGKGLNYAYRLHFFTNRKTKLIHIDDWKEN